MLHDFHIIYLLSALKWRPKNIATYDKASNCFHSPDYNVWKQSAPSIIKNRDWEKNLVYSLMLS